MTGGIVVSPNPKRERVLLDRDGNLRDPKTKQIIQTNQPDYVPTAEDMARVSEGKPVLTPAPVVNTNLTIQQQIDAAEKVLAELRQAKKKQIEDMKKQIAELEKS